ncbi:MAG: patatin-like phospholipase family protein [Prevotella sp.]|nr:patatin-like phospholipase family protein [Prevotella sp.]
MKKIMLLLICLCLGQSALAQEKPKRKKVAVVLSGGGAKGMAHIGVLKVLERAGIPVDIITGTSMGSIIGGLYACGRDAAYLDSIVRAQDWGYVLSDHEDLSHQSLSEREKRNTYFLTTSLNLEKKTVDSDGGFIIGKNIYTLFNALTAPYNDSIDFNKLPIPFACVATNIVDNSEYDFHSGVLSTAMRASMSIPGAFSPVRMGDKVLVDGGLRNNFPADIAREMGADYIIGVTVQGKAKTADELASTSAILSQIVDVNCKNKYEENLAITDIPIRVNTSGYGSASFNNVAIDTLIRRGEEAAMEHWDDIVKLREKLGIAAPSSARHGLKPRMMVIRQPLLSSTKYKIGELVFENMTPSDEHFIRSKFKLNEGDSIDANRADLATTSMRLDLFYKSANFMITNNAVNEPNGEKSAKVVFVAGPKKTNEVYLGIRFDREEMVALQANVAFPLRTKLPTELDFTLRLGKRIMGRVDFEFHPTSVIRPTISYVYRHNDINLYEYGDRSYNITYNQHSVRAYPVNFNVRNFNVSLGAEWNYYNFQNLLVDRKPEHQVEQPDNLHLFSYHGVINYNSENEWYFPRKGAKFNAKYSYYTDNFVTLKDHSGISEVSAMWRMSFPVGSFFTFQPMLYGRLLMGSAPPFIISNSIGGEWFGHYVEQQVPFAGIGYMEQAWDKLVAMQLKGQFNLTQNNIILLRFAAGQNADKFSQLLDHSTMLGTSVSYYYNTPFGPLGATLGYCNITEKMSFNVNLGFVF